VWLLLAAFFSLLNLYLCFLRYSLYRLLGWEYRFVSGIGLVSSVSAAIGVVVWAWAAYVSAPLPWPFLWACCVLALIDPLGAPRWGVFLIEEAVTKRRKRIESMGVSRNND
jgi:hypothetical protein